jgi:hypothetical protein
MRILVVGATGATGRLLVRQLLDRGHKVLVIVRDIAKMPAELREQEQLSIIRASLLKLTDDELAGAVAGCQAIASCLGHNMTLKGIYGPPRRLVTEAMRRLVDAVKSNRPASPVRLVLMNTAGNRNPDLQEPVSLKQTLFIALIRRLVPPHADNEQAANYLRTDIGQEDAAIQWCVVRPDTLTHDPTVTEYSVHPSPTRSAIFDPGATSRINVAHFMAELLAQDEVWERWRGQMPVVYNETASWESNPPRG